MERVRVSSSSQQRIFTLYLWVGWRHALPCHALGREALQFQAAPLLALLRLETKTMAFQTSQCLATFSFISPCCLFPPNCDRCWWWSLTAKYLPAHACCLQPAGEENYSKLNANALSCTQ